MGAVKWRQRAGKQTVYHVCGGDGVRAVRKDRAAPGQGDGVGVGRMALTLEQRPECNEKVTA